MAHFIHFQVGGWKVGGIDSTSGVFVGHNLQYGWRDTEKSNGAAREVTGDGNVIHGAQNTVIDPDLLDTWVQKPLPYEDITPPSPMLARQWAVRRRNLRRASGYRGARRSE